MRPAARICLVTVLVAAPGCSPAAQRGPAADMSGTVTGKMPQGPALAGVSDAEPGTTEYDMQVWKALLRDHTKIRRTVRHVERGVAAETESDDPRIAALIKDHVLAMKDRLRGGYPVRGWDPVFRELFARHDRIRIDVELTEKGVRISETSDDPETVRLMRSHAAGVSDFVKEGVAIMDRETPYIDDRVPAPPVAKQVRHVVHSPHGDRVDEYHWLRDDHPSRKRDDVMEHLRAEQAYTEAMMARIRPLEESLRAEIRGRIKEDDSTAPAYDRGHWHWQSFASGAEYPRWMRQRGGVGGADAAAPEEVLLDVNELARGKDYMRVSSVEVSPDGSLLAWTQDTQGRRGHQLLVKDLRTGELRGEPVPGTLEPIVWASDSRSIFYVRQDPVLLQSGPVCRHVIGAPPATDTVVHEEPDTTLFTSIAESADRTLLLIEMEGYDTNELRAVPLDRPDAAPRVILPRTPDVRQYADRLDGTWVIRTNRGARNFRLATAADADISDLGRWTDLVPHRSDASIDSFALFRDGVAVGECAEANAQVRIVPWSGGAGTVIPAQESAYAMTLGENRDPANPSVRVTYTSMVTPRTTIDVALRGGGQVVRKVQPVIGYDRSQYDTARVWAPSRDGKRIPVSIAWRKDAWSRDGKHPILIEGYGAYGYPSSAAFDLAGVSLMDRGFALATAHVRGGADLGQDWYEDGRKLRKRNTFNDFIDVTDHLAAERWCDPSRRFASGGSAGGLLMGAVANMAGDRYRGMVLGVPFVDALTTMLDPTIPLTTNEWTQWGNPIESKEAYDYILSYSPYDNIAARAYPAMLVTTGLWDSQVGYFEPAKYVARLRRLRTDSNPLVLDINLDAGHGGKSGRFQRLRQIAREQAFMIDLATR